MKFKKKIFADNYMAHSVLCVRQLMEDSVLYVFSYKMGNLGHWVNEV